jgi:hypothetical protein
MTIRAEIRGVLSALGGILLGIYIDAARDILDSLLSWVFRIPKPSVGFYVVVAVIVVLVLYSFYEIGYSVLQRVRRNKNKPPILIGQANNSLTVDLKSKAKHSKIHLFCVSINGNRDVLRETAQNVEVVLAVLNPPPVSYSHGLASVALPWLNMEVNRPLEIGGDVDFQKAYDVIQSMSSQYLKYEKTNLEQGRGEFVVAFFGLESTGKIYVACKDPIELQLGPPIEQKIPGVQSVVPGLPFVLGVSGTNFDLVRSNTYIAIGTAWDKIDVMTVGTPIRKAPLLAKLRRYWKHGYAWVSSFSFSYPLHSSSASFQLGSCKLDAIFLP